MTTPGQRFPYGLGRRIEHDPASRGFMAAPADPDPASLPRKVRHRHYGPVLDQGRVGACVGFTGADALNTKPLHRRGERILGNEGGLELYAGSTRNDQWQGNEVDLSKTPPAPDEGSSGLGLGKYLLRTGRIMGYSWTFTFAQFLAALGGIDGKPGTPMCIGIGWTASMFEPDSEGYLRVTGPDVGGHEVSALAYQWPGRSRALDDVEVEILNHWRADWGINGRAILRGGDMRERLADQGDAMRLTR